MYNHKTTEEKWRKIWLERKEYRCDTSDFSKPKYYALDMFPYPSGQGLHVGHPEGYTATDIVCRMKRMQGFNVLHPIGWDAFGLPAEQYTMKMNEHPEKFTLKNIDNFRRQIKMLGFSYDYYKSEYQTMLAPDLSEADLLMQMVLDERRREFVQEGLRWFDMKRFKLFPITHEDINGITYTLTLDKAALEIPDDAIINGLEPNYKENISNVNL